MVIGPAELVRLGELAVHWSNCEFEFGRADSRLVTVPAWLLVEVARADRAAAAERVGFARRAFSEYLDGLV